MNSEFYIGYLPKMPESIKRIIRIFVVVVLLAGILFAVLFATGQHPFANSIFEFGNEKVFRGSIIAKPVPFLLVEQAQSEDGLPLFEWYPLVGQGKFGVSSDVTKLDGKRVRFSGTLIYRDGLRMIEVVPDTIEEVQEGGHVNIEAPGLNPNTVESLGNMTLKGEIIDSKCYLGVMNPGNKKTHRDCAVACLRGGVPAMFLVKDERGNKSELWLLSDTGEAINDQILDYVAEPLELTGRVTRDGDQLFYWVKPTNIKRL